MEGSKSESVQYAVDYLRLSIEDRAKYGDSESIKTQRSMIESYCERNNIVLVKEFVDDGYSGGNFDRPAFRAMLAFLEINQDVKMVLTKTLSRLGRDMGESSYYAESYFPERRIRYIAITDNFDSDFENTMAPFQFAMNEVYLRDGSKNVRRALQSKRENGEYCATPPYGYKKDPDNRSKLVPDEMTAPIVEKIFRLAAQGQSSRQIADALNAEGVIPPLKYRVEYRDCFSEKGAAKVSDYWNYTTVKRILRNEVYLGHTLLGKSKKVSFKSKKKLPIDRSEWIVTPNTHPALISEEEFEKAKINLAYNTKKNEEYGQIRHSIFGGIVFCECCGHALCSCGSVYKGEREKYWYLECNNKKKGNLPHYCTARARIHYGDLVELIKKELNSFIDMDEKAMHRMVDSLVEESQRTDIITKREAERVELKSKIELSLRLIHKYYVDFGEGTLDQETLDWMISTEKKKKQAFTERLEQLEAHEIHDDRRERYEMFLELAKRYTHIEELDRDMVISFIDRIEVGPKILPEGIVKDVHRNKPYRQNVRIFYKFIGEIPDSAIKTVSAKKGEDSFNKNCKNGKSKTISA